MWTSSALSISSSMPVILPARSGNMRWMRGNSLSPSICFCSCGGAAASIVAVKGSWPCTSTACWGGDEQANDVLGLDHVVLIDLELTED